ncbi:MAG: hypothetical protein P8P99_07280 [Maricaulis sp.]|nr:hypothetical protein [Maricaulis sp.]
MIAETTVESIRDQTVDRRCVARGGLRINGALPQSSANVTVLGAVNPAQYYSHHRELGTDSQDIPDLFDHPLPRGQLTHFTRARTKVVEPRHIRSLLSSGHFDSVTFLLRPRIQPNPNGDRLFWRIDPPDGAPAGYYRFQLLVRSDPACRSAEFSLMDDEIPSRARRLGRINPDDCFTRTYIGPVEAGTPPGYLLINAYSRRDGVQNEIERLYAPEGGVVAEYVMYRSPRYSAGLGGPHPDYVCPNLGDRHTTAYDEAHSRLLPELPAR